MKIRTDFVTNSSSSGFVLIQLNLKNGEKLKIEDTYDSGWGGYFWNGGNFKWDLYDALTGLDVLNVLAEDTEGFEFIENMPGYDELVRKLTGIKSVKEIDSIVLQENTNFDEGRSESFSLKHSFSKKKPQVKFISHNDIKPAFKKIACVYGRFTNQKRENDYSEIVEEIKKRGWIFRSLFVDVYRYKPDSQNYNLMIVGDKTADEINKGKIDEFIKTAISLRKSIKFEFITESEFLLTETTELPFFKYKKFDTLTKRNVICAGNFQNKIREFLMEKNSLLLCGEDLDSKGKIETFGRYADCIVIGERSIENYNFDYSVYGWHGGYILDLMDSDEDIPVYREKDFISLFKDASYKSERKEKINCNNRSFAIGINSTKKKKEISEAISSLGGKILTSAITEKNVPDFVIYDCCSSAFNKACILNLKGYNIKIYSVDYFLYCIGNDSLLESFANENKNENENDKKSGAAKYTVADYKKMFGLKEENGCYTITEYKQNDKSVVIPDKIGKKKVIAIGGCAFENCTCIESVKIGENITRIGPAAFSDCTGLIDITVSDNVMSVGCDAFNNTAYYNNANNWEKGLLYLGKSLIKADNKISGNCIIRPGTRCIGEAAFENCTSLAEVTIPDSVINIENGAFENCSGLINVILPIGLTVIRYRVFKDCTELKNISLPQNTEKIEFDAFSGCTGLTDITIPDGVKRIGDRAFLNCTNLASITIPDSITSIGDSAFSGCKNITELSIPDGITMIDSSAFSECDSLKEIIIPGSVSGIGNYAFSKCTGLTKITIHNGVKKICRAAFYGCTGLTDITIPGSVNSLGDSLFYECTSLENLVFENGITRIQYGIFNGCKSVKSVTIPESVTNIDFGTFWDCKELVIKCCENSFAHKFAVKEKMKFELI